MAACRPRQSALWLLGAAVAAAGWLLWAPPTQSFTAGPPCPQLATRRLPSLVAGSEGFSQGELQRSRVAMRGSAYVPPELLQPSHPKAWKIRMMRRMPHSELSQEEIMKRITTVLIQNMGEKYRDAPMRTKELMKSIGLRGPQIKTKRCINHALDLLRAQKVVYMCKQNPKRYEIHEEFRKYGVPPISGKKREPWKHADLLKFPRTKTPKFGPAHGLYRPQDKEFLLEQGLPIVSIKYPRTWDDPFAEDSTDLTRYSLSEDLPKDSKGKPIRPFIGKMLPLPPKDEAGNYLQHDWMVDQPFQDFETADRRGYHIREKWVRPKRRGGERSRR